MTKYAGPDASHKFAWDQKLMEEEEKRERRRKQRMKVVNCCKTFTAFLFSHVGLAGKHSVITVTAMTVIETSPSGPVGYQ